MWSNWKPYVAGLAVAVIIVAAGFWVFVWGPARVNSTPSDKMKDTTVTRPADPTYPDPTFSAEVGKIVASKGAGTTSVTVVAGSPVTKQIPIDQGLAVVLASDDRDLLASWYVDQLMPTPSVVLSHIHKKISELPAASRPDSAVMARFDKEMTSTGYLELRKELITETKNLYSHEELKVLALLQARYPWLGKAHSKWVWASTNKESTVGVKILRQAASPPAIEVVPGPMPMMPPAKP